MDVIVGIFENFAANISTRHAYIQKKLKILTRRGPTRVSTYNVSIRSKAESK